MIAAQPKTPKMPETPRGLGEPGGEEVVRLVEREGGRPVRFLAMRELDRPVIVPRPPAARIGVALLASCSTMPGANHRAQSRSRFIAVPGPDRRAT
jgi:hypothetical protein